MPSDRLQANKMHHCKLKIVIIVIIKERNKQTLALHFSMT